MANETPNRRDEDQRTALLMDAYEARIDGRQPPSRPLDDALSDELEGYLSLHQQVAGLELEPVPAAVRAQVMAAASAMVQQQRHELPVVTRWLAWLLRPGPLLVGATAAAVLVAVVVRVDLPRRAEGDDQPTAMAAAELVPARAQEAGTETEAEAETASADEAAGGRGAASVAQIPASDAPDPVASAEQTDDQAPPPAAPEPAQNERPVETIAAELASLGPAERAAPAKPAAKPRSVASAKVDGGLDAATSSPRAESRRAAPPKRSRAKPDLNTESQSAVYDEVRADNARDSTARFATPPPAQAKAKAPAARPSGYAAADQLGREDKDQADAEAPAAARPAPQRQIALAEALGVRSGSDGRRAGQASGDRGAKKESAGAAEKRPDAGEALGVQLGKLKEALRREKDGARRKALLEKIAAIAAKHADRSTERWAREEIARIDAIAKQEDSARARQKAAKTKRASQPAAAAQPSSD